MAERIILGRTTWFNWRRGFSINEGFGPVNMTVIWGGELFFYIYAFGWRWHTYMRRK